MKQIAKGAKLTLASLGIVALLSSISACNDTADQPAPVGTTSTTVQDSGDKPGMQFNPNTNDFEPGIGLGGNWQLGPDNTPNYDFGLGGL